MSAKTHTGNVLLTLDPEINGSTELTMEHRYVKFSDPGCISFEIWCGKTDKRQWLKTVPPWLLSACVIC